MILTDLPTDRIINGFVKGHEGALSPQDVATRLARDVVVRCEPGRCNVDDLWPALWALASVLERQLTGRIYIDAQLSSPLPSPVPLGPRCVFGACPDASALTIELGTRQSAASIAGDARLHSISLDPIAGGEKPTPIECFLLAGYLGFQVLAALAEVPAERAEYAQRSLRIEYGAQELLTKLRRPDGFTFVGMGQVGQAFLALLWFWFRGDFGARPLVIIDDDKFIKENGRTQILLAHGGGWLHEEKAGFISILARTWNAQAAQLPGKITYAWKCGSNPPVAFVGTHDFDSRRMACVAGFEEIIECGVGTDMMVPRVTWVSARGDTRRAKSLFNDRKAWPTQKFASSDWVEELKSQPGKCGWVQFEGVSATAPCLGITAVAYALAESTYPEAIRQGAARLWSQFLPPMLSMHIL